MAVERFTAVKYAFGGGWWDLSDYPTRGSFFPWFCASKIRRLFEIPPKKKKITFVLSSRRSEEAYKIVAERDRNSSLREDYFLHVEGFDKPFLIDYDQAYHILQFKKKHKARKVYLSVEL